MKKAIPVLVLLLVLAWAGTAQAATGILTDSTAGGGYLEPTAGQSPHGGYDTTTNKCKVCHAVHGATGPEYLLRTTTADSCIYCHVSTNFSIKHPYGTDPAAYRTEYENNHASTHQGTTYQGCPTCHSVHGTKVFSNAADGIGFEKILRQDPGGYMMRTGTGAVEATATSLNMFCRDCHDKTSRKTGSGTCGTCHDATAMMVTDDPSRGGPSHVMTTDTRNNAGLQVAITDTSTCRSCHRGGVKYQPGQTNADGNSFPHITNGAMFLADYHGSTGSLDRVCMDCHVWGGGTSGVGQTY